MRAGRRPLLVLLVVLAVIAVVAVLAVAGEGEGPDGQQARGTTSVAGRRTPAGPESGSSPADGTFAAIDAGLDHTCALDADGAATCWGDDAAGQATPPGDAFTTVSAGGRHT